MNKTSNTFFYRVFLNVIACIEYLHMQSISNSIYKFQIPFAKCYWSNVTSIRLRGMLIWCNIIQRYIAAVTEVVMVFWDKILHNENWYLMYVCVYFLENLYTIRLSIDLSIVFIHVYIDTLQYIQSVFE